MKKIILVLLIFLMSGCYNYTELNELAIATGFAVDIKDDEFEVTVLISNSQKKGSGDSKDSASAAVYRGTGKTIFEAIKDASLGVSKQIYVSHIEVLVLSEEVAKEKTSEVIDLFFRYPQTRNEFYVILAENCNAGDIFDVTTPLETFPSQNISKNLEITNKLQSFTYTVTFNEFIRALIEEGTDPILPTISIIGNVEKGNKDKNIEQIEPDTYLKLGMMSIFKKDSLVAIAKEEESKGINFINNEIYTTLIDSEYKDGNVVIEINNSKTDTKVEIENEKIKAIISIDASGSIEEMGTKADLMDTVIINEIENTSIEKIKELVNKGINFCKENKSDVFGIGNLVYKKDHKLWKRIKDKWNDEIFGNIEFEIDVKLNLKTKGSINSIIEVN